MNNYIMWYLTSTNDKRFMYVLSENSVTIGRSVDPQFCNFAIPEDPSISRKHAMLFISDSHLHLEDLGSKYGTFLNDQPGKLQHNAKVRLNCNDVVKFGKMGSIWKVNSKNFITCTSTLKGDHMQILRNALTKIGGVIKSDWDETCTFLTMPSITLTIKVVLALVQGAHIVNIEFWNKCVEAIKNNSVLPDPNNYVPQILESTLNKESVSFLPHEGRKSIFKGKQVIFFSRRQFDMYKLPIQKSSGTPLLLSETKMTKSMLCEDNVIVIQYNSSMIGQETQSQRDHINEINGYLKTKGKRMIADAEIGLAILYSSLNKYCNPDFSFSTEVIKHAPSSNKEGNVLAQETQEQSQKIKKENVMIDESLTPQEVNALEINNKRKLSEDAENSGTNANKKIALDDTSSASTSKRTCEDSNDSVPSKKIAVENNEDMFNFLEPAETTTKCTDNNKMLNLFKPLKRKIDERDNEDDLFNFEEDKKDNALLKSSSNKLVKKLKIEKNDTNLNNTSSNDKIDIETLRGSKLKELMELNANMQNFKSIKKEETEIDEKFKNIDLGSITLVVKKDLVIKREPLSVITPNNGVRNFKKFKKVWPIKLQVTLVSNASEKNDTISKISNEEGNSMSA